MSFLNWPAEKVLSSRRAQQRRRRVVSALLNKFGSEFPEITYELLWQSFFVNAHLAQMQFLRLLGTCLISK